jgi:hypothetical protein
VLTDVTITKKKDWFKKNMQFDNRTKTISPSNVLLSDFTAWNQLLVRLVVMVLLSSIWKITIKLLVRTFLMFDTSSLKKHFKSFKRELSECHTWKVANGETIISKTENVFNKKKMIVPWSEWLNRCLNHFLSVYYL